MEVLAKPGGFILSGIIELVINRYIEKAQEHWLGSRPKLRSSLQNIQNQLSLIKGRIVDAEKRAYINHDSAVKAWMESLHDIICDADKVLDEIEYRALKEKFDQKNNLRSFIIKYKKPFSNFECVMTAELDEIEKKLIGLTQSADSYNLKVVADHLNSNIHKKRQPRETTSMLDNMVFGRDDTINDLIERLIQNNPTIDEEHILPIIGMGGIGKTTLAQMVYNHEDVKRYFDLKIWVCVSCDFDEEKIIIKILESISYSLGEKEESERNYVNLDVLIKKLVDKLKGKRYFLVLDDVWNENHSKWQIIARCLKIDAGNMGSKVLVTTRNKLVASIVSSLKPILLDKLSDDILWHILKTFVFGSIEARTPELEEILEEITIKLKGSPLAAKTVGYILRSKANKRYWENILNSEIWTLKQNEEDDITPALMLSYQNLPEYLKLCFAFCSLYPKDYVYEKKEIVRLWIALGYIVEQSDTKLMEDFGEDYVNELLDRSMFETCTKDDVLQWKGDAGEFFKVHDLIHDVAKMVSANDSLMIHDKWTLKQLPSSIRNLCIYIDNRDWSWKGHDSFDDFKNVRTLICLGKYRIELGSGFEDFLQKALPKMKFLRVLDVSRVDIETFPLPNLKHLRYLNLNVATVDNLAGSLAYLFKLQVLECWRLEYGSRKPLDPPARAPARQIRYLESLRHMHGFGLDTNADPFLEKFHFLQELDLSVSKQSELSSTKKEEKGHHKLKVLRAMKWLRELCIRGLENVEGKEEALEAELKNMDRLTKLRLLWDGRTPRGDNVEEILEALHPGPNIGVLEIKGYDGAECPGWMESLSLLRELEVYACKNMKFIRTRGLKMIKRLEFHGCGVLRVEDGFEGFGALNTLEELAIYGCTQLTAGLFTEGRRGLPSSLKKLEITIRSSTPILNVSGIIMQSLTNLTALGILSQTMAPSPINPPEAQQLQHLSRLELFMLTAEEVKGWFLHLQGCTALVDISLGRCSGLLFDKETEDALISLVSLRKLNISGCEDCLSLPSRLCEFPALKELYISECPNISCLPLERGLPAGLQIVRIQRCPLLIEYVEKVREELHDRGWDVEAYRSDWIEITRK